MVSAILPLLVLAAESMSERFVTVTAEQVTEQLKVLSESKSVEKRQSAAAWFVLHSTQKPLLKALKPLEVVAAFDDSPEVRGYAVYALGRIAMANKAPCPQVVYDALFDRQSDEEYPEVRPVPDYAVNALHEYRPPSPALLPVIVRLLRSTDPECRSDGILLINNFTREAASRKELDRQPTVARLLRKATTDPELNVRRVAAYSQFKLTGDVAEFLGNALRHQDDVANLPPLPKTATERESRVRSMYTLGSLGVATMMAERLEDSATGARDAVLKLLKAPDARTRRLTADHIGRMAVPVAEPQLISGPNFPALDTKKHQGTVRSIAGDASIRERLKAMTEKDSDERVREAAKAALGLIEKMKSGK